MLRVAPLAVVIACGAPHAATPDATSGDARPLVDAQLAPIEVVLSRGSVPIAGAPVVAHDADGNPLATYATDASGYAIVPAAGVAMITAVDADDTQLYTVLDVAPGDRIAIPTYADIAQLGSLEVTLPAPPPGAVGFQVFAGDDFANGSSVASPFTVATTGLDVATDGTITVIGLARDASYNIIAVATATAIVPPAHGETATVTTGAWSTAMHEFHLNVTHGTLGDLVNTTEGQNIGGVEYALPSLTGNNAYIRWWPVAALGGYIDYSAQVPSATQGAKRFCAKRLAPDATSDAIDLATLLPALTGTSASSADVARPTLTVAAAGSTAGADGLVMNTRWSGARYAQWAFVAPATRTSIRFPALPAALAMWTPDVPVAQPYAVLIETTYDADYAAFRADGAGLVGGPRFLHDGAGTLLGSTFFPQPF